MGDRTDFVPRHVGDNILPASSLFTRLVTTANCKPTSIAVKDINLNSECTYPQLLTDIINLRRKIGRILDAKAHRQLENGEEVFLVVVAPGGYDMTVAVLAIVALGAAAVPISTSPRPVRSFKSVLIWAPAPNQPVKEATYYVQKCHAAAVLANPSSLTLGQELEEVIQRAGRPSFKCLEIHPSILQPLLDPSAIRLSSDRYVDPNRASLVIFTSGTTGPPKGVVQRRALVDDGALYMAQQMEITSDDVLLHILPVHHATGIEVGFFPWLISGACIEFCSGSFNAEWTWNRWSQGDITFFSGVPAIYTRMMRYYQQYLSKLPAGELSRYVGGARSLRGAICGTSALPHSINNFWTDLFGTRIVQRYGSTESNVIFNMPIGPSSATVPDGSVGKLSWGADVRLSGGNEGEILLKHPFMFAKYLHDPDATANAHTSDGYFKSGDVGRREGEYYWILGRESVDILKSGGYKISALDVEREILALSYISEVMVVGVADDEFGQRVAAVVSLQVDDSLVDEEWKRNHASTRFPLTLEALRSDLSSRLAGYKRPTLLRVIEGELPRTASGKVIKKTLGPIYFPENYAEIPEVQSWKAPSSAPSSRPRAKL